MFSAELKSTEATDVTLPLNAIVGVNGMDPKRDPACTVTMT